MFVVLLWHCLMLLLLLLLCKPSIIQRVLITLHQSHSVIVTCCIVHTLDETHQRRSSLQRLFVTSWSVIQLMSIVMKYLIVKGFCQQPLIKRQCNILPHFSVIVDNDMAVALLWILISSALETFATIALYKSTYTIPYHTILSLPLSVCLSVCLFVCMVKRLLSTMPC